MKGRSIEHTVMSLDITMLLPACFHGGTWETLIFISLDIAFKNIERYFFKLSDPKRIYQSISQNSYYYFLIIFYVCVRVCMNSIPNNKYKKLKAKKKSRSQQYSDEI